MRAQCLCVKCVTEKITHNQCVSENITHNQVYLLASLVSALGRYHPYYISPVRYKSFLLTLALT